MLLVLFPQPMHSVADKIAARRNKQVHVLLFIAVKFLRIQRFSRVECTRPGEAIRRGRRCGNRAVLKSSNISRWERGSVSRSNAKMPATVGIPCASRFHVAAGHGPALRLRTEAK